MVLMEALEEHVEHGNIPDSPVTLGEVGMTGIQADRQLVAGVTSQADMAGDSGTVAAGPVRAVAASRQEGPVSTVGAGRG